MNKISGRALRVVIGIAAVGAGLFLSDDLNLTSPPRVLLQQAQAYVGNPLTPMSYAGVARRTARRTTRRNMYYGGYYGGY